MPFEQRLFFQVLRPTVGSPPTCSSPTAQVPLSVRICRPARTGRQILLPQFSAFVGVDASVEGHRSSIQLRLVALGCQPFSVNISVGPWGALGLDLAAIARGNLPDEPGPCTCPYASGSPAR